MFEIRVSIELGPLECPLLGHLLCLYSHVSVPFVLFRDLHIRTPVISH